jgi:hypothetical protein
MSAWLRGWSDSPFSSDPSWFGSAQDEADSEEAPRGWRRNRPMTSSAPRYWRDTGTTLRATSPGVTPARGALGRWHRLGADRCRSRNRVRVPRRQPRGRTVRTQPGSRGNESGGHSGDRDRAVARGLVQAHPQPPAPRSDEVDLRDHRSRPREPLVHAQDPASHHDPCPGRAHISISGTGTGASHPATSTGFPPYRSDRTSAPLLASRDVGTSRYSQVPSVTVFRLVRPLTCPFRPPFTRRRSGVRVPQRPPCDVSEHRGRMCQGIVATIHDPCGW